MSDKTCAERIEQHKMDRNAYLEDINYKIGDDEISEEMRDQALEELSYFALEISSYKTVKILLSTGGPSDWIEVEIDENDEIIGMKYHLSDWFDHASVRINRSDYLWDYAYEIVSNGF